MASLYHRLGREIGDRPFVLPSSEFFPDPFNGDEESVRKLLARMQLHAGLQDIPIELRIIAEGHAECAGGCGHHCSTNGETNKCNHESSRNKASGGSLGACGSCEPEPELPPNEPRLIDLGDTWRLQLPVAELSHNVVLTSNMAKSLGLIFLLDTRPPGNDIEEPVDVTTEVAAVALGFGGLLLAASYLYSKSCGGPRVAQATRMSCGEIAVLTALFAERGRHKLRHLRKYLQVTQAAALDEAANLLRNNPAILDALRTRPAELSADKLKLNVSGGGVWQRWFESNSPRLKSPNGRNEFDITELEAALSANRSVVQRPKRPLSDTRHDELRNLVEEALAEGTHET